MMMFEELLHRVARDGDEAALSWLFERDPEPPLSWLPIVPSPRALEWLEARLASPVVVEWGETAALLGITWPRIEEWLRRGRPHSLAALDALVAYADMRSNEVLAAVRPVLREPPSRERLQHALEALARLDDSPRATKTIAEIVDRADVILRGGPSTGVSARTYWAERVELHRREREENPVQLAGTTLSATAIQALHDLVNDVVSGRFDAIERKQQMGELTREDIQRALAEYPATFVPLPPDALDALDVMPVRPGPRQFAVDIPLWSVEEGRSDLSLSVNVDDSLRGVRVAIANLHVL